MNWTKNVYIYPLDINLLVISGVTNMNNMIAFSLQNARNEEVVKSFYHDAFIHTEDKTILNAHKVILSMHSQFFHNYFQSRPGHAVNDIQLSRLLLIWFTMEKSA